MILLFTKSWRKKIVALQTLCQILESTPETGKSIHNTHCKEYPFYLHAAVVFKQRHQVAVLTDLVLDVPHQRADTWFVATVGVSWHAALQEVLLLRILLQRHKELCHLILLLKTQRRKQKLQLNTNSQLDSF